MVSDQRKRTSLAIHLHLLILRPWVKSTIRITKPQRRTRHIIRRRLANRCSRPTWDCKPQSNSWQRLGLPSKPRMGSSAIFSNIYGSCRWIRGCPTDQGELQLGNGSLWMAEPVERGEPDDVIEVSRGKVRGCERERIGLPSPGGFAKRIWPGKLLGRNSL